MRDHFKEIPLALPALREVYARIGGEARVREILRDFYGRMAKDLLIGFFFEGRDPDLIADKQAEFLLRAMGARREYAGKAPAKAHEELPPVLAGHFDRRLTLLEEALRDWGLAEADIRIWVSFENTFRDAIVSKG